MAYVVHVYRGFSNPIHQRQVGKFERYQEAVDFCERDGIQLEVELAERGPETIWGRIEKMPD